MQGALLMFPGVGKRCVTERSPEIQVERLDLDSARELLPLVQDRLSKAEALLRRLTTHRQDLRAAGLESLIIEISAIVEGNKVHSVRDSLEEAIAKSRGVEITQAALDRVHRLDFLISEANTIALPAAQGRNLLAGGKNDGAEEILTIVLGTVMVLTLVGSVAYALLKTKSTTPG